MSGLRETEHIRSSDLSSIYSTERQSEAGKTGASTTMFSRIGNFFANFKLTSKAENQQQSAQKKSWTQSISDFFSGFFRGSQKTSAGTSPLEKGASVTSISEQGGSLVGKKSNTLTLKRNASVNAPYFNTSGDTKNHEKLLAKVNVNDTTALIRTGTTSKKQQENTNRESWVTRASEEGSFLSFGKNLERRGEEISKLAKSTKGLNNVADEFLEKSKQLKKSIGPNTWINAATGGWIKKL